MYGEMFINMFKTLLQNSIITASQAGFTRGELAINQLISITTDFREALGSGKEIVICDTSKAFDRAWHKLRDFYLNFKFTL